MEPYLDILDFIYKRPELKTASTSILLHGLIIKYEDKFIHNYAGFRMERDLNDIRNRVKQGR